VNKRQRYRIVSNWDDTGQVFLVCFLRHPAACKLDAKKAFRGYTWYDFQRIRHAWIERFDPIYRGAEIGNWTPIGNLPLKSLKISAYRKVWRRKCRGNTFGKTKNLPASKGRSKTLLD
jgi:hypothetical protein